MSIQNDITINFQPMPKRFMVWDKGLGKFLEHAGEKVYDLPLLTDLLDTYNVVEIHEDLLIIQSTNLFDKDGKEIFEGSIVRRAWECARDDEDAPLFLVIWSPDRAEFAFKYGIFHNGVEQIIDKKALRDVEVVDHILSSPELLEEV